MLVKNIVDTRLTLKQSIYRLQLFERFKRIVHGISRRRAPDLTKDRDLNFRPDAAVDGAHAMRHRILFCNFLDVDLKKTVWLDATEPGPVRMVGRGDCGKGGRNWDTRVTGAAGIVTRDTDVFLCTIINDNTAVFLFDPRWYVCGLVNVDPEIRNLEPLNQALQLMQDEGDVQLDELVAIILPSLGPCCHEFPDPRLPGNRNKTNVWDIVRGELNSRGILRERILNPRACSGCRPFDFYSRHTTGEATGAGAVVFGVSDEGDFGEVIAGRREQAAGRKSPAGEDKALLEISLSIEQQRLNKVMKCSQGHNKVYIRSLLDGTVDEASDPVIALRCTIFAHVGLAEPGRNVLDKSYIERFCCNDYQNCVAYRKFKHMKQHR